MIDLSKLKKDPERTEFLLRSWEAVHEQLGYSIETSRANNDWWSDSNVDPINAMSDLLASVMAFAYDEDEEYLQEFITCFDTTPDDAAVNNEMTASEMIEAIIALPNF